MEPYKQLGSIGKKARKAAGRLNCEKCPMKGKCTPIVFDVCTYVFDEGFRKGYNQRKKEEKCKRINHPLYDPRGSYAVYNQYKTMSEINKLAQTAFNTAIIRGKTNKDLSHDETSSVSLKN